MNKLIPAATIAAAAGLAWIFTAQAQQAAPAAAKAVKYRHKMVKLILPLPDKAGQHPFSEKDESAFDGWEVVSAVPMPFGSREVNGVSEKLPVTLYTLRQRVE